MEPDDMSDSLLIECETSAYEESTSEEMDPTSHGLSIASSNSTTSDLEHDKLEYDVSDGSPIEHGIPPVEENSPEAMDVTSIPSPQNISGYFGPDSSFWNEPALTQPLNHNLNETSNSELDEIDDDYMTMDHGTLSVEENTPEAMDQDSIFSPRNISGDFGPDSSFWTALTQPLDHNLVNPSYAVTEQVSQEHSIPLCQMITSDFESYELDYDITDGLPIDHGTPSEEAGTLEVMDSMSQEPSIPWYHNETSAFEPYEINYNISDYLTMDHGASVVEENIPEAMDQDSIFSPRNISGDFGPDSSFWSALTPPVLVPDGIFPILEPRVMPLSDESPLSMMNLILPEDTIKSLDNKKLGIPKDKGLTMLTVSFEIVTRYLNSWMKKKRFHESTNVYFFSFPKRLLSYKIIHQVLRFKAHETVHNFRMHQKLVYRNRIIDQWFFEKRFVRSHVITNWETFLERSPSSDFLIDPTITSRVVLETKLYDGERLLHEYQMQIILT